MLFTARATTNRRASKSFRAQVTGICGGRCTRPTHEFLVNDKDLPHSRLQEAMTGGARASRPKDQARTARHGPSVRGQPARASPRAEVELPRPLGLLGAGGQAAARPAEGPLVGALLLLREVHRLALQDVEQGLGGLQDLHVGSLGLPLVGALLLLREVHRLA